MRNDPVRRPADPCENHTCHGAYFARMRRVLPTMLVLAGLAAGGCGVGGQVHAVHAWPSEPPYIPPRDPAAYARANTAPPAPAPNARPGRSTAAVPSAPADAAPTDAEVARELRQALGGKVGSTTDLVNAATLTGDGMATVPPSAPSRVVAIISAANQVARKPYVYGGGHGRFKNEIWIDTAYDCSGSVSFALASAGLINAPMDSTSLERFGRPGRGKWVTIYANAGHAFMTVAGLRFDTSGQQLTGSRWQTANRTAGSFTVRHPAGL
jgi:cell wall-associated NlpC family hydrolase